MKKYTIYLLVGLLIVLAIPLFLNLVVFDDQKDDRSTNNPDQNGKPNGEQENPNTQDGKQIYWGVDSASSSDEGLYQCVNENYGRPEVWGRYLGDMEGVSADLDSSEISFLHENGVRILLIHNHFEDATGYNHGVEEAKEAIEYARELGAPKGVALFADIEPTYPVNSSFMQGWYDTLSTSKYEPGIYGVFDEGSSILTSYKNMSQEARENTVVWTAFPQSEITTKENAPEYHPQGPDKSLLYGWQYAIMADQCAIDTDLFQNEMLDFLW